MTRKLNTSPKKSPAIAIAHGDEELADNGGKKSAGGLVDDKLLASSAQKVD